MDSALDRAFCFLWTNTFSSPVDLSMLTTTWYFPMETQLCLWTMLHCFHRLPSNLWWQLDGYIRNETQLGCMCNLTTASCFGSLHLQRSQSLQSWTATSCTRWTWRPLCRWSVPTRPTPRPSASRGLRTDRCWRCPPLTADWREATTRSHGWPSLAHKCRTPACTGVRWPTRRAWAPLGTCASMFNVSCCWFL